MMRKPMAAVGLGSGLLLPAAVCLAMVAAVLAQSPGQVVVVSGNSQEIAAGQIIFNERCAICHYDRSEAQKIGPGLKGVYARGKFADGKKVDDAGLAGWIDKGGKDMPGLKDVLKPAEIRTLISYLKTL
jgi:mono/diheme cytochrome c family protein